MECLLLGVLCLAYRAQIRQEGQLQAYIITKLDLTQRRRRVVQHSLALESLRYCFLIG
jgi:hypothetical protein